MTKKILSTKRRRRDDVKQEPISKHQFLSRAEDEYRDTITGVTSEHVIDAAQNLSIDDEHDYDKKTEDVVVVFKVESDNTKIDSSLNSTIGEYSENKLTVGSNIDFPVEPPEPDAEDSSFIKTAVVSTPNKSTEQNIDVNVPSDHQHEKLNESNYVIYSRSNLPVSNDLQNEDVSYNSQFSFTAKNSNISQQFSQHE